MIQVKGTVNINVSPEQVFALISDARQCAELNPRISVIDIVAEPLGEVHKGTVFHNRIVVEGRLTEYSSKVVAFEPDSLLQIKTDTYPEVSIKYHIRPTADGACLEQELTSSVTHEEPIPVNLPGWFARLVDKFTEEPSSSEQDMQSQQQEEAMLKEELQVQLDEWLTIVKKYLEAQRNNFLA